MNCIKLIKMKPGLMLHTCNPRSQEVKAENLLSLGSPVATERLTGQPGLYGLCRYIFIYIYISYIYIFFKFTNSAWWFYSFLTIYLCIIVCGYLCHDVSVEVREQLWITWVPGYLHLKTKDLPTEPFPILLLLFDPKIWAQSTYLRKTNKALWKYTIYRITTER